MVDVFVCLLITDKRGHILQVDNQRTYNERFIETICWWFPYTKLLDYEDPLQWIVRCMHTLRVGLEHFSLLSLSQYHDETRHYLWLFYSCTITGETEQERVSLRSLQQHNLQQLIYASMTWVSHIGTSMSGWKRTTLWPKDYSIWQTLSWYVKKHQYMLINHDKSVMMGNNLDMAHGTTNDIVLDLTKKKLFIAGKKITSSTLHSQVASVEILFMLLIRAGDIINNYELPISSYSKSKNQMTSKIVFPLKKIIKELTGKTLDLRCRWSLHTFTLQLTINDVTIGVMKYLHADD